MPHHLKYKVRAVVCCKSKGGEKKLAKKRKVKMRVNADAPRSEKGTDEYVA